MGGRTRTGDVLHFGEPGFLATQLLNDGAGRLEPRRSRQTKLLEGQLDLDQGLIVTLPKLLKTGESLLRWWGPPSAGDPPACSLANFVSAMARFSSIVPASRAFKL